MSPWEIKVNCDVGANDDLIPFISLLFREFRNILRECVQLQQIVFSSRFTSNFFFFNNRRPTVEAFAFN